MLHKSSNARGFTIVELLIATTVFAVILLIAARSLLDIGATYYKGYISSRTQQTTRNLLNSVTQSIEFGGKVNISGALVSPTAGSSATSVQRLCIGDNVRYTMTYDKQLSTTASTDTASHVVLRDKPSNCTDPVPAADSSEMLEGGMRIAKFEVVEQDNKTYKITIRVIYGSANWLESATGADFHQICASGTGRQYCSVSELTTTVQQRLGT